MSILIQIHLTGQSVNKAQRSFGRRYATDFELGRVPPIRHRIVGVRVVLRITCQGVAGGKSGAHRGGGQCRNGGTVHGYSRLWCVVFCEIVTEVFSGVGQQLLDWLYIQI